MKSDEIRSGERYVVRYRGEEITVKAVSRCPTAVDSWICERADKISLIVPTESFLRPAYRRK